MQSAIFTDWEITLESHVSIIDMIRPHSAPLDGMIMYFGRSG